MSAHPSLDRDAFQSFLANAYAMQTSGLDTRSLSALVEMQRFIMGDEFDLHRAMLMMAAHAVKVCNASGVAIAVLEGKELVYRAGAGTAGNDVGRHVPAVLSVSPGSEERREIVKVEDAQIDSRVEAGVCRQFGANSILMLPIYRKHVLFGVLQVQFDEAHCFLDRELRAYRLMLRLLEDAILRQPKQQQSRASSTLEQIAHDSAQSRELQHTETAIPLLVAAEVVEPKRRAADHFRKWAKTLHHRTAVLSVLRRSYLGIGNTIDRLAKPHFWQVATAMAVSVMLAIATWSVYGKHPVATTNGLSTDRDSGQLPAKVLFAGMKEDQLGNGAKSTIAKVPAFRRVRIGSNEVDYVAEDVTIRTFRTRVPIDGLEKEVRFGDDVTVHYFRPSAYPVSSRQQPH